jgi:hypothetical protein
MMALPRLPRDEIMASPGPVVFWRTATCPIGLLWAFAGSQEIAFDSLAHRQLVLSAFEALQAHHERIIGPHRIALARLKTWAAPEKGRYRPLGSSMIRNSNDARKATAAHARGRLRGSIVDAVESACEMAVPCSHYTPATHLARVFQRLLEHAEFEKSFVAALADYFRAQFPRLPRLPKGGQSA